MEEYIEGEYRRKEHTASGCNWRDGNGTGECSMSCSILIMEKDRVMRWVRRLEGYFTMAYCRRYTKACRCCTLERNTNCWISSVGHPASMFLVRNLHQDWTLQDLDPQYQTHRQMPNTQAVKQHRDNWGELANLEKMGRWITSSKSGLVPNKVKGGDLDIYIGAARWSSV